MIKSLIVILGPTGIGKTSTSIEIAKHLKTEIISCDSRQIFKELKIGTAVPPSNELSTVKHHFIQTHSIHNYYNASQFEFDVLKLLDNLFQTYDSVVMTGGSMLYIDAVCKGIDDLPTVDKEIREDLIKKYEVEGLESLRLMVKQLDPVYYKSVDLRNAKRILHALEISVMTGKPYSSFLTKPKKIRPFKILKLGLNCDRDILYNRINQRVDQMIDQGLVDEARSVYPYKPLNALNTVGYKELFDHFDGKISLEEAIEQIKAHTRKYARKQLTWFKKDQEINWFETGKTTELIKFINANI